VTALINYEFLVSTSIALVGVGFATFEYLKRRKVELEMKNSMVEILDKLNKLNKSIKKIGGIQKNKSKQSEVDSEIKKRQQQLREDKFSYEKLKDASKAVKWILNNIDVED
jgi:hypothetical protein